MQTQQSASPAETGSPGAVHTGTAGSSSVPRIPGRPVSLTAALTNAVVNLSEDINALRTDVAELRSEIRSVREQNNRQDNEIWAQDGTTRLESSRSILSSHTLQIKGLWATVTLLIGAVLSYATYHLR